MTLLETDRLSLAIGRTPILKDVSLRIAEGETLGLVGESGSGKSMTALAIMGLLPDGARVDGAVHFEGDALQAKSEPEMCALRGRDISMVFQEPMTALNPLKTIGDQVAETVRLHRGLSRGAARDVARQTLERVGLPESRVPLDRYPHDLSGGQRQRAVIAIAIVLGPKLLIADEPTTALDVTTQATILQLLQRLAGEEGMGMLFITHDLAVVARIADRIAIMKEGAIVEEGRTENLFGNLQHPYSQALLAASGHTPARKHRSAAKDGHVLQLDGVVRDYRLRQSHLWRRPARFRAVDGVSFAIRGGENVALVGESGCGKSTLLRAILGLEPLSGGEIWIRGESILSARGPELRRLRRQIQVVFQDPYGSFDPRHRVERLIAEPFYLLDERLSARERRRRVETMLERVGLAPVDADRYPHEFSGGQRQRIAIARALIIEPAVIALDEAVSALDVSVRAKILDLLADLSDRLDLSYLFVSHDLSVVRAIADRVLVMKDGRIVEEGKTDDVFARPQHAYTAELIAATPTIAGAFGAQKDHKDKETGR